MEIFEWLKTVFLGIVEGITEWLPISSTGHMILVDEFLHLNVSEEFMNMFRYVIQLGAILAVVVLFFHKLNPFSPKKTRTEKRGTWNLWGKVIVACIPSAVMGVLVYVWMDEHLMYYWVVAAALIVYGVLFLFVERGGTSAHIRRIEREEDLSYRTALLIGLFQVLSIVPGTSRSGSTILGGIFLGCSRSLAAEFSFFLAIPTMVGVSILKVGKYAMVQLSAGLPLFTAQEGIILALGMVTAFVVSLLVIRFLMDFVRRHDFKAFGWYRIALGAVVLGYFLILGR